MKCKIRIIHTHTHAQTHVIEDTYSISLTGLQKQMLNIKDELLHICRHQTSLTSYHNATFPNSCEKCGANENSPPSNYTKLCWDVKRSACQAMCVFEIVDSMTVLFILHWFEGLNPGVVDTSEEESTVYISKRAVCALFSYHGLVYNMMH